MFKHSQSCPPDPPEEHRCAITLQQMNINRQRELILRPGDRIWYKSSIYRDKYYDAVIQEIFPGPWRTTRQDVFESPKSFTILQKYELKNGEKINLLPPEGRIMMRYWTLEPGVYETANCPFSKMASSFVKAANEATKDVSAKGQMYLMKLKEP